MVGRSASHITYRPALPGDMQNFLPYLTILICPVFKMEHIIWQGRSVGSGKPLEFPGFGDVKVKLTLKWSNGPVPEVAEIPWSL